MFSWFAEQEPVFFSHDYYRGATPQTATLIPGTADVESYTVDPVADGGKKIYRRDRMVNALQASLAVFSNGIAVAATAGWWTPDSIVDVDFQNNRARINGVSYSSIAAARTAGAIKKSAAGVDYTDVSNLPASYVLAAKGTPASNTVQIIAALDDGDDAVGNDEIVYIGQRTFGGVTSANAFISAANTGRISPASGVALTEGQSTRIALRVKSGSNYLMCNGAQSFASANTGAQPAVTRLTYGKRSVSDHLTWTGAVHRVTLIPADLTNAQINALLA